MLDADTLLELIEGFFGTLAVLAVLYVLVLVGSVLAALHARWTRQLFASVGATDLYGVAGPDWRAWFVVLLTVGLALATPFVIYAVAAYRRSRRP